jgi:hypothetical protein
VQHAVPEEYTTCNTVQHKNVFTANIDYQNLHTFVGKNFSLNVGMSISDKKEFPKNLFWWCQLLKNLWRPRNRETSNNV